MGRSVHGSAKCGVLEQSGPFGATHKDSQWTSVVRPAGTRYARGMRGACRAELSRLPDGRTVINEATVRVFGVVVGHLSKRITRDGG